MKGLNYNYKDFISFDGGMKYDRALRAYLITKRITEQGKDLSDEFKQCHEERIADLRAFLEKGGKGNEKQSS